MLQTVKVRLRKPGRVHVFVNRNKSVHLNRNDNCIVKTERGQEFGVCVFPPEECSEEESKRFDNTIVRKASPHDTLTWEQIKGDEERAVKKCFELIRTRKLKMKLVDCEYSFDRKKIIFYFTADDRVDFRELVKDLAADLKARIELRHIQVRDEAKIIGGIGSCGRELCCTSWMREFMPISMKMAKKQNLSLNPSKISGQCGRLMCCLSYENDMYQNVRKSQPKKNVKTGDLSSIRDKMESNTGKAADTLSKTTMKDVVEPPQKMDARQKSSQKSQPSDDAKRDPEKKPAQTAEASGDASKTEGGQSGEAPRRKRNRGRRRRGGKPRNKNQGN